MLQHRWINIFIVWVLEILQCVVCFAMNSCHFFGKGLHRCICDFTSVTGSIASKFPQSVVRGDCAELSVFVLLEWKLPKNLRQSHWCIPFTATFSKRRKIGALWRERCDTTLSLITSQVKICIQTLRCKLYYRNHSHKWICLNYLLLIHQRRLNNLM